MLRSDRQRADPGVAGAPDIPGSPPKRRTVTASAEIGGVLTAGHIVGQGRGGDIAEMCIRDRYTDRCRALRKQRQSPMDFEADVKATCRAIGEVGVDGA